MSSSGNANDEKSEYQKLKDSPFKQQTMPVWRPQLNPVIGLITFGLYTIVFFIFGAVLYSSSEGVVDVEVQYNELEDCKIKPGTRDTECTVDINITDERVLKAPVYFYYQLDNFYQN